MAKMIQFDYSGLCKHGHGPAMPGCAYCEVKSLRTANAELTRKLMAKIEMELLVPCWPDFIGIKRPARPRQVGFSPEGWKIPIAELTTEQVEWLCESLETYCLDKIAARSPAAASAQDGGADG